MSERGPSDEVQTTAIVAIVIATILCTGFYSCRKYYELGRDIGVACANAGKVFEGSGWDCTLPVKKNTSTTSTEESE